MPAGLPCSVRGDDTQGKQVEKKRGKKTTEQLVLKIMLLLKWPVTRHIGYLRASKYFLLDVISQYSIDS